MKLFQGLARTDYQDVLRGIGLLIDERGWRNIRLIEHDEGILIQGMPTVDGHTQSHYETFLLSEADIGQILHLAYSCRGRGTAEGLAGLPVGQQLSIGRL